MRFFTRLSTTLSVAALSLAAPAMTACAQEAGTGMLVEDDVPAAPVTYEIEVLAEGVQSPYSIAFLPDDETYNGDMLFADKSGALRLISDDELVAEPVAGMPDVLFQGQAGFFDVVLHPDFAENGMVYLTYATGERSSSHLRLARAQYVPGDEGAGSLENLEVIFTDTERSGSTNHYGGRVVFLPDGTLLLTIGEGYRYMKQAQSLDNYFGKIVRLNDDGSVPEDNPFVGQEDALPEIWTYGHRNQQGLIYDAATDRVIEHEHGPKGGDEINVIEPGTNYGWPVITYGIDYSGASITPFTEMDGMAQPDVYYVPSIAPSGFTLYRGDMFPDWDGDLFIGALAHEHVRRVEMNADGSFGAQEELLTELGARIRDVRTGPDGYLYVLTDGDDGQVLRLKPAE